MPRVHQLIQDAIRVKYTPKITVTTKNTKGEVERTEVPDPDVIWVGDILDGLCLYLPEINQAAFSHNPSTQPDDLRRHLKSLLRDTATGGEVQATHFLVQELVFLMRRQSWAKAKGQDTPAWVRLNDRLRENTPGELLNSPQIVQDDETMELQIKGFGKDGIANQPVEPVIREDKRFGLHYLKKGDEFTFTYKDRRKNAHTLRFILRPLGEGSSLVTPERSTEVVAW